MPTDSEYLARHNFMPSQNHSKIAKNTLLLYFRMILVMLITFYTSRVVLSRLGVNDYGIYNVVGGIVMMFSIVSASLSSAISRFLTFELGRNNESKLKTIFSSSIIIQACLGLIIVILVETIGVWFLNNKMNISPERMVAANWVLQCSALAFIVNMLSVPYNAAIIAHEKMQAFAYVSILEVSLKLGIAFLLYIPWFDSLIVYAALIVISSLIIRLAYAIYCKQHFQECHFFLVFDKNLLKEMFAFSGWTFIGSTSSILRDQGVNIVINLFCGTAVNAARGIAMQVYNAIHGFSQNFILAVNPQIIKSYACGDIDYMFNLSFRSSRFSFYLLFCISLPLIIQMNWLLSFWLETVPEFTLQFSIWILIFGMTEAISVPLQYVNQASGKVKVYQLVIGGIQMLNFPLSYLLLWLNFSPVSVFVLAVLISLICLVARLLILHKEVELRIFTFCNDVLLKIIIVSIFGTIIPFTLFYFWNPTLVLSRITLMLITFASACLASYYLGCQKSERDFISRKIESALKRLPHNA